MATLTLRHQRRFYEPRLPHLIFIDDLYAGTMQDETQIQMPAGHYKMRVQFGGKIPLGKSGKSIDLSVSSTCDNVEVKQHTTFLFRDREWLWNLLFDIDLIVWLVSLFIPLTRLYRILSDSFFVIWLVRLLIIRKRYYRIIIQHEER
jgi:hypothetical protein